MSAIQFRRVMILVCILILLMVAGVELSSWIKEQDWPVWIKTLIDSVLVGLCLYGLIEMLLQGKLNKYLSIFEVEEVSSAQRTMVKAGIFRADPDKPCFLERLLKILFEP